MRVLVVEDDLKIGRFVAQGLEAESFAVDLVASGREGLDRALSGDYDLILLDLMLPGVDGLEILRRVRATQKRLPVIVLTARGEVEDRVKGLDCGADDYLVKPFSFVELQARIRALFRRTDAQFSRSLRVGALALDRVSRQATCGANSVDLSSREFQLLEYLLNHPGEPLTRAMLADRVWGYQFDTGTNVVDVYVNYVRKKLRDLGLDPIHTLRGIGYRLDVGSCGKAAE